MRLLKIGIVFCSLLLWACVKDKPTVPTQPQIIVAGKEQVLTIAEGNYGSANASLGLWDADAKNFIEDVYKAGNGSGCGDVLQSITKQGGNYYLIMNNSAKVIVCDGSFKKTGEVNGLTSPRYLQIVSPAKAYVSDLYANAISILDLNTATKTGSIAIRAWTERMAMIYNKVFVTTVNSAYLYVINTITDKVEDSVLVGENASGCAIDKEAKLWVLLRAKSGATASKLVRVNALNNKVDKEISIEGDASNLQINAQGSELYFINAGVQKLDIKTEAAQQVVHGKGNYYGLGISPKTGTIYLSDAKDYTQRSEVSVYSADGTELTTFRAGVNCNGFYFE